MIKTNETDRKQTKKLICTSSDNQLQNTRPPHASAAQLCFFFFYYYYYFCCRLQSAKVKIAKRSLTGAQFVLFNERN